MYVLEYMQRPEPILGHTDDKALGMFSDLRHRGKGFCFCFLALLSITRRRIR